jgi:hypothetical protein
MMPHWTSLNEYDRAAFRAAIAFLKGRLEERATIDWALRLRPNDISKRLALLELIDSLDGRSMSEPWRTAWRLIEEFWNSPAVESHTSLGEYRIQHRLQRGDRSGALVAAIVDLVAPRLEVGPFSDRNLQLRTQPKRLRKANDLFSTGLTSGDIVDPSVLGLETLTERSFLLSLANALDAAVSSGLDIARRIGWDEERSLWQLGGLHRVCYVGDDARPIGEHEPDEFHQGIAPSVKLLHAVISRLVDIDVSAAVEFVRRWQLTNSPVHLRLWAALSCDSRITPANEVAPLLLSLDDRRFWNLHDYPEIAELRAKRFDEIDSHEQAALTARIRKRPPRKQWPRGTASDRLANARLYWAVRELRRIEIAGGALPHRDKAWLNSRIIQFPDLVQMTRLDEGFIGTPEAQWVPANPDSRYDGLVGWERLKALEAALLSTRRGWDDNPAERAADWISQQGNSIQVLADLESIPDGGAAFAEVWERFGWTHSPAPEQGAEVVQRDLPNEAARVLTLLAKLTEPTARQAIEGISHWLSAWKKQVVSSPEGLIVWSKLWPIAVTATNATQPTEAEIDLNTVARSSDDREPMDLDTLNTPSGKLVGVFLAACPNLKSNSTPFDVGSAPRTIRDIVIAAPGRSGLIARHRMIEHLPYFLHADPQWAREQLIIPLIGENVEALALWRAIARKTQFKEVLKIIGGSMAERATDPRLGRETRRSLVFSLIVECLHAFLEQREPAVPFPRVQQMIRSLDDEVRAHGAQAIQRFVHDLSAPRDGQPTSRPAEDLFRSAAGPFLRHVWPQERSLTTPSVSRALADLPATARGAFVEAVDTIERFLVPFECWSMLEYGLYGEENGSKKLSQIITTENAAAFLRLLDRTIGTAEGSVIPLDLADALDHVRKVAPNLAETQAFRRLATAARRA